MQKYGFDRYSKVITAILAVLLVGQLQHARHQHSDIVSLNMQLSIAQGEIEVLGNQLSTSKTKLAESNSKLATANIEIDQLKSAAAFAEITSSLGSLTGSSSFEATGRCNDGSETFAVNHRGACSWHGGVAYWY